MIKSLYMVSISLEFLREIFEPLALILHPLSCLYEPV